MENPSTPFCVKLGLELVYFPIIVMILSFLMAEFYLFDTILLAIELHFSNKLYNFLVVSCQSMAEYHCSQSILHMS